jgi:hypothetical protein
VNGDSIHVDLADWPSPSTLVINGRPDIAVKTRSNSIGAIELTVCHELNSSNAAARKQLKYCNLKSHTNQPVKVFTVEVTTLGFTNESKILQVAKFIDNNCLELPQHVRQRLSHAALRSSFFIYCRRDKDWPNLEPMVV